MLPWGGGRCDPGVHFFSESLIFSPTLQTCNVFPLNDILKVFPIQMHWRSMLTLLKNRSMSSQGHDLWFLRTLSRQCFTPSFVNIGQPVSEKKILKCFYHIWALRPSWSCDIYTLIPLSYRCFM